MERCLQINAVAGSWRIPPRSCKNAVAEERLNSTSPWHHPFSQSSGKEAFHPRTYSVFAERLTMTRAVTVFKTGVQG